MNNMNTNDAAFPRPYSNDIDGDSPRAEFAQHGLSKREYFAALAMQGLLSNPDSSTWDVAEDAVKAADALIEELNK